MNDVSCSLVRMDGRRTSQCGGKNAAPRAVARRVPCSSVTLPLPVGVVLRRIDLHAIPPSHIDYQPFPFLSLNPSSNINISISTRTHRSRFSWVFSISSTDKPSFSVAAGTLDEQYLGINTTPVFQYHGKSRKNTSTPAHGLCSPKTDKQWKTVDGGLEMWRRSEVVREFDRIPQ